MLGHPVLPPTSPPQHTGERSLHSLPEQPLQGAGGGRLSSGGHAHQLQRLPCVLPRRLRGLLDGVGSLRVAAKHEGRACEKGFPLEFSPPASFTVVFSNAGSHPLGKRSVFEKGTHILLVPPASLPRVEEHQGEADAACSNWPPMGQTLTPKMLLKHTQHHLQRQTRTDL